MVRGVPIADSEGVPRAIIALENDYPDGYVLPSHNHRRSQLLYGASGAVMVATLEGTWVMPPRRGMWIPAGVLHDVRMLGEVRTLSLYLEPEAAIGMPDRCQVVGISPFMFSLMTEAVDLPIDYDPEGRAGALMVLILHEMQRLPVLPLSLPFPAHGGLAQRCRQFLRRPTPHETIEGWSEGMGMSRRAFTRLFRRETGLSFGAWRQQACLVAALPRLVSGEPVTAIAIDLGYDNPAAFTTMFKRVLGSSPRNYLQQNR